jgi:hypothetical protein
MEPAGFPGLSEVEGSLREPERLMRRPSVRCAVALTLASAALGFAATYEGPRTFLAAELLTPEQLKGPHYEVGPLVHTEGYLHVFNITTDFGPLEAEGRSMLLMRLHEVGALERLDDVSKSEVFVKAVGTSMYSVGKNVALAVQDPKATAQGVGSGLKRFGTNLGRQAKRVGDQGVDAATTDEQEKKAAEERKAKGMPEPSATDKAAAAGTGMAYSVLGVNSASRKWAQKVGADPYTTNPILKKALVDIGQIDAAGNLATKIVVPIPFVVTGTATVGGLVWSKDPEELRKINERQLKEMGVGGDTIKQLYLSKGFTLTLHTRLASNLREVNVPGCGGYAVTAAQVDTEREATFFVESAEMLARFHKATPVSRLLSDSRALVAKTRDGRAVVLLPVDWVRWTAAFETSLGEIERRAKEELGATAFEMRLTGTMSAVAKGEMKARKWTVVERLPLTIEVALEQAKAPKK